MAVQFIFERLKSVLICQSLKDELHTWNDQTFNSILLLPSVSVNLNLSLFLSHSIDSSIDILQRLRNFNTCSTDIYIHITSDWLFFVITQILRNLNTHKRCVNFSTFSISISYSLSIFTGEKIFIINAFLSLFLILAFQFYRMMSHFLKTIVLSVFALQLEFKVIKSIYISLSLFFSYSIHRHYYYSTCNLWWFIWTAAISLFNANTYSQCKLTTTNQPSKKPCKRKWRYRWILRLFKKLFISKNHAIKTNILSYINKFTNCLTWDRPLHFGMTTMMILVNNSKLWTQLESEKKHTYMCGLQKSTNWSSHYLSETITCLAHIISIIHFYHSLAKCVIKFWNLKNQKQLQIITMVCFLAHLFVLLLLPPLLQCCWIAN